jgi:hypothetical protein
LCCFVDMTLNLYLWFLKKCDTCELRNNVIVVVVLLKLAAE